MLTIVNQALEVVWKRRDLTFEAMRDALSTMDTKERIMRQLDIGTTNLSLLINIGNSVSVVSPTFVCSGAVS